MRDDIAALRFVYANSSCDSSAENFHENRNVGCLPGTQEGAYLHRENTTLVQIVPQRYPA